MLAGGRVEVEAELGGDHHLVPHWRQSLAHEFLVVEGPVHLGGVEEGDPAVHRLAEERDHLLLRRERGVGLGHAHAAEAQGGDLQALAEEALLHGVVLSSLSGGCRGGA